MLNVSKIIRSLISIAFVSTVHAATLCAAQLTYHSIGTKDGLASMFVLTLHQDANGFIWVGTYNGVSILGGNNAQVLYPERQELKDLQGSCVENIQSTDNGQVWIQNNFGMHLWDPRHNGLQHFYEAKGDNRCTVSPVGDVVVFTQQKGFLYFNKVKRQFLPLVVEHISWDDYLYMSIDRESRLTLFTRDERITYKLITDDEGSVTTELMIRGASATHSYPATISSSSTPTTGFSKPTLSATTPTTASRSANRYSTGDASAPSSATDETSSSRSRSMVLSA